MAKLKMVGSTEKKTDEFVMSIKQSKNTVRANKFKRYFKLSLILNIITITYIVLTTIFKENFYP